MDLGDLGVNLDLDIVWCPDRSVVIKSAQPSAVCMYQYLFKSITGHFHFTNILTL